MSRAVSRRTSWGHDTRVRATYTFSGTWEIPAPVADVHAVLVDLERYPDWWPQVVAVASPRPGRRPGAVPLGAAVHARPGAARRRPVAGAPRGRRLRRPRRLGAVRAGRRPGRHPARPRPRRSRSRGLLGLASYVGGPVLRWNHHRMMDGCVAGLRPPRTARSCGRLASRRDAVTRPGLGDGASVAVTTSCRRVRARALARRVTGGSEHVVAVGDRLDDDNDDVRLQAARDAVTRMVQRRLERCRQLSASPAYPAAAPGPRKRLSDAVQPVASPPRIVPRLVAAVYVVAGSSTRRVQPRRLTLRYALGLSCSLKHADSIRVGDSAVRRRRRAGGQDQTRQTRPRRTARSTSAPPSRQARPGRARSPPVT